MKQILVLLSVLLIAQLSFSQTKVLIRGDSTLIYKVGGYNELIIENSTKGKLGAYLKNAGNGRTVFEYAIDSAWIDGSTLNLKRGADTIQIDIPAGGGSGTDNALVGTGFRILKPSTQQIKTLFEGGGMKMDSTTNTNGITMATVDTINSTGATSIANLRATDYQNVYSNDKKKNSTDKPTVELLGYYGANGSGAGRFYWDDTSTMSDNNGTIIKPTSVSGAGRWKRLLYNNEVNVDMFGAIPDDLASDFTAFQNCFNYVKSNGNVTTVHLSPGQYDFTDTIIIDFPVKIYGSKIYNINPQTVLAFSSNTPGMKTRGLGRLVLENVTIKSINSVENYRRPEAANHIGLEINTISHFKNVVVWNFQGDGIVIHGNGTEGTNTDQSTFTNVKARENRRNGFYLYGEDANIIAFRDCEAVANGAAGWRDYGFLGNYYTNNHCAANSSTELAYQRGCVSYDGVLYYCKQDSLIGGSNPSINTAGWGVHPAQPFEPYAPDWSADSIYLQVGAYLILSTSAFTSMVGNYAEQDNPPSYLTSTSFTLGGDMPAHGITQGLMIRAFNSYLDVNTRFQAQAGTINQPRTQLTSDGLAYRYSGLGNEGMTLQVSGDPYYLVGWRDGTSYEPLSDVGSHGGAWVMSEFTPGSFLGRTTNDFEYHFVSADVLVDDATTGGRNYKKINMGSTAPGSGAHMAGDLRFYVPTTTSEYLFAFRNAADGNPGTWEGLYSVPPGGTANQVLRKTGSGDGAYSWQTIAAGGSTNSNIGSGFRWAVPNTNDIKTAFFGYGLEGDSTTNTDGITVKVDTATLFPAVRATIPAGGGSGTPGGSDGEFQYNNAGAFAGLPGLNTDGTNVYAPALYGTGAANGDMTINSTTSGTVATSVLSLQSIGGTVGINNNSTTGGFGNLTMGTQGDGATSTPEIFSQGASFSDEAGNPAKAKWKMYDDGTPNNTYGMGISSGQFEHFTSAAADHVWYWAGVEKIRFKNSGDITVADEAYDATAWNGSLEVPTKNAIRDKIESLSAGSGGFFTPNQTSTGTTTHDANYNIFNLWNLGRLFITAGTNGNSSEFFQDSVVVSYGVVDNTTSHSSVIQVRPDSIRFLPSLGIVNFDTLEAKNDFDSSLWHPTIFNPSTGQFKMAAYWPSTGGSGGIADPGGNGIMVRTALNTTSAVSIAGTTNKIGVTNGNGTGGNPTINIGSDIVDKTAATTYTAGMKQTFQSDATNAGMNFAGVASDPSSLSNGDLWHNTTSNSMKVRLNGTTRILANTDEAQTLTNKTFNWANNSVSMTTAQLNTALSDNDVATLAGTETLTNKRITKRTGTAASSATPTINTDNVDAYYITAQTVDITSMTTNLSGTPTLGQTLRISITGTATRAITWGSSFVATSIAIPTTTSGTSTLNTFWEWNGSNWAIAGTW